MGREIPSSPGVNRNIRGFHILIHASVFPDFGQYLRRPFCRLTGGSERFVCEDGNARLQRRNRVDGLLHEAELRFPCLSFSHRSDGDLYSHLATKELHEDLHPTPCIRGVLDNTDESLEGARHNSYLRTNRQIYSCRQDTIRSGALPEEFDHRPSSGVGMPSQPTK